MNLKTWDDYIIQDIADFFNTMRSYVKQKQDSPYIRVFESDDGLFLESEIPGIEPEDLNLELKHDILTLSFERKNPIKDGYKILKQEIEYGKMIRNIQLPYKINENEIKAEYKNGVLKIFLPKAEEEKPKKIAIQTNS